MSPMGNNFLAVLLHCLYIVLKISNDTVTVSTLAKGNKARGNRMLCPRKLMSRQSEAGRALQGP